MKNLEIVIVIGKKEYVIIQAEKGLPVVIQNHENAMYDDEASDWIVISESSKRTLKVAGKGWAGENP